MKIERKISLTEKEIKLIAKVLTRYEENTYMSISQKENDWLFDLIDKFDSYEGEEGNHYIESMKLSEIQVE